MSNGLAFYVQKGKKDCQLNKCKKKKKVKL